MHLEERDEAQAVATATLDSLQRHEIAATPDNYAIWYEYHAGHSPKLKKTIDVIQSNRLRFDERTLRDLYKSFPNTLQKAKDPLEPGFAHSVSRRLARSHLS
jgi:diguanylate cyclase